mmetsp:Transcript_120969/g.376016  ORF Transcript_120969/g.376016 Transcript_120969/m.376016 type:complete len:257 (+) Transcript_120969:212-982(+)
MEVVGDAVPTAVLRDVSGDAAVPVQAASDLQESLVAMEPQLVVHGRDLGRERGHEDALQGGPELRLGLEELLQPRHRQGEAADAAARGHRGAAPGAGEHRRLAYEAAGPQERQPAATERGLAEALRHEEEPAASLALLRQHGAVHEPEPLAQGQERGELARGHLAAEAAVEPRLLPGERRRGLAHEGRELEDIHSHIDDAPPRGDPLDPGLRQLVAQDHAATTYGEDAKPNDVRHSVLQQAQDVAAVAQHKPNTAH